MLTTHVYIGTSLDGFIARKDGSYDWLSKFADQAAVDSYAEFMTGIDVIIIGRGTFETVLGFPDWPYDRPTVVLSRSPKEVPDEQKERVALSSREPKDLLRELSESDFHAAYVDGGKVIQSFLAADLIDELTVARVPVLIGDGIPLFGHLDGDLEFEHESTTSYSNGLIRSHYRRIRHNQSDI